MTTGVSLPSSQVHEAWLKQDEFVPPAGAYLENCKYVDHGYFGNSEVRKLDADAVFIPSRMRCG